MGNKNTVYLTQEGLEELKFRRKRKEFSKY